MTGLEVLASLLPAAGELIKGAARKWLGAEGRPKATSPDEWAKMQAADTERLKALAQLDSVSGQVSPWVANLRASSRYIIAYVVTVAYIASELQLIGVHSAGLESAAASVWFFLFGERALLKLKRV